MLIIVKFALIFRPGPSRLSQSKNWCFDVNQVFVNIKIFLQRIHGNCVFHGATTPTERNSNYFVPHE